MPETQPQTFKTPKPYAVADIKMYINLLLYGPPGVGKTTLAATAQDHPLMKNVLFINFEGGLLSVTKRKGIEVVDIKNLDELEALFWALIKKDAGFEHFQTIVLDSGTEMQTLSLELIARRAFETARKNRESIDDIFQEDYGKDTARLKRIFRWFRDAPFHLIVTALPRKVFTRPQVRGEEPKLIEVVPSFTDKLGQSVRGYCDFVWYMYQEDTGKRSLLTQESGAFKAKTRGANFAAAIGNRVENPNLATLFNQLLDTEGPNHKEKK